MSLHRASRLQSFVHVPAVHVPLQTVLSVQSKLQKLEVHVAEQRAESSQRMLHGPDVHAIEHLLALSQVRLHGGVVQTKSHVSPSVQVQLFLHSFGAGAPVSAPPASAPPLEEPPSVPTEPLLLLLDPPLELLAPEPLPMVQSYEQPTLLATRTKPTMPVRGTLG